MLGIGAYDPYIAAHATPEQAVAMADQMRADRILPMHHSTFRLSHEPMTEPLERIRVAVGNDADRLVATDAGDIWSISPIFIRSRKRISQFGPVVKNHQVAL
jgi:L-ascorbate metabolism protein UlaG (beta-lactamase superfamily)